MRRNIANERVPAISNGSVLRNGPHLRMSVAMQLMLQGYEYSRQLNRSIWDFAVEIAGLRGAGLTNNDLRWLMCQDLIQHAWAIPDQVTEGRAVRQCASLHFSKQSCFVLTPSGLAFARNGQPDVTPAPPRLSAACQVNDAAEPRPIWDCDRREIRVSGELVKQFKLPSPNQETILMAFQEDGWPPRIDDPLPCQREQNPKRRLQDTIRSLNRNQKARRIRFKGDGTGEGILWELISPK